MPSPTCHWSPPAWIRALPDLPPWTEQRPQVPWNLRGMLRAWQEHPLSMDFLDPSSANYHYKALQTRLYSELLGRLLNSSGWQQMRILDAACGIGRFLIPLAEAGHTLVGVDACEPSLRAAERHIAAAMAAGRMPPGTVPQLHWDDVEELSSLANSEPFDLVLAMELLCYLGEPRQIAEQLSERLRPGGHLVVSVEAWPGALLCDQKSVTDPGTLRRALRERVLAVPGDRWLRAVDAGELESILQSSGLEVLHIEGSHYLPDGPLSDCLDLERLADPSYVDEVLELERLLRSDQSIAGLPRAWLAVAQKPG